MPFYWRRRKRWWWRNNRRYKTRRWGRYRNRRFRQRKRRRPARRRRRRRKKVRRKLKKIPVKQWQPQFITRCKIRGMQLFVLGAQGKQCLCYTDERYGWTPPKAPGGGGFSHELYTLQWLFHEYEEGNNVWTRSNATKDLLRYGGCKIKLFRHAKTDFIVYYNRDPQKELDKYQYCFCHPKELLLRKHTRILHSKQYKNYRKNYITIFIKPPRKLQTNWYFMSDFAPRPLLTLTIAAADLTYSYISCCDTNRLLSLYTINTQYYQHPNWGKNTGNIPFEPYSTVKKQFTVVYENGKTKEFNFNQRTYPTSVEYSTGWFQSDLLKAWQIKTQNVIPIGAMRYNPKVDDGKGNAIWLKHITQDNYDKPRTDKALILEELPLWQLLYGFLSYAQKAKPTENILTDYILCIQSPAIYPFTTQHDVHIPIDSTFINGKGPFEETLTAKQKELWFPTVQHQQQSINNIVMCGPFIPKYNRDRESTWDLHGFYNFYFKWGGDEIQNQEVNDPTKQVTYDTPNYLSEAIQISNPAQQLPTTLVHSWDIRRGLITPAAFRRIQQNLPIDETLSTAAEEPPKKKKKYNNAVPYQEQETKEIQECLQKLFEQDTYQEPQNQQELLQLIQQQQQQQQLLKYNLLQLIADLKSQQKKLQFHTGLLN
nr:MAG: ORF1 [Torque teno midi virus]